MNPSSGRAPQGGEPCSGFPLGRSREDFGRRVFYQPEIRARFSESGTLFSTRKQGKQGASEIGGASLHPPQLCKFDPRVLWFDSSSTLVLD